jgi:TPR repeat protein
VAKQAAYEGNVTARFNDALHLERRTGVGQDLSMAGRYYNLALDQRDSEACSGWDRCSQSTGRQRNKGFE